MGKFMRILLDQEDYLMKEAYFRLIVTHQRMICAQRNKILKTLSFNTFCKSLKDLVVNELTEISNVLISCFKNTYDTEKKEPAVR